MEHTSPIDFVDIVKNELQRAERYRIFISLTVIDISSLSSEQESSINATNRILDIVKDNIRTIDSASIITNNRIGLLFPETPRQGAEIVAKRIATVLKEEFKDIQNNDKTQELIPLEMASYPDAAGARSIKDFMHDLSEQNLN